MQTNLRSKQANELAINKEKQEKKKNESETSKQERKQTSKQSM